MPLLPYEDLQTTNGRSIGHRTATKTASFGRRASGAINIVAIQDLRGSANPQPQNQPSLFYRRINFLAWLNIAYLPLEN